MADRLEFKEKLAGILALAEGQNGKITVDEVEKYFEEDGLSQEQMNLVCDYLLSMKMAVVGYKQTGGTVKEDEKEEKQPLSAEEQKYVEEYLRGLGDMKEETQEEQITEPTADQAAQEEQAAPVAAEAADSVKYLKDIQVYETLYWTGSADELRDPLKMEQCGEDEYNLYLYDNQWIGPFALVNLAEDAPEDTVITASWYHLFMEEQNSEKQDAEGG